MIGVKGSPAVGVPERLDASGSGAAVTGLCRLPWPALRWLEDAVWAVWAAVAELELEELVELAGLLPDVLAAVLPEGLVVVAQPVSHTVTITSRSGVIFM